MCVFYREDCNVLSAIFVIANTVLGAAVEEAVSALVCSGPAAPGHKGRIVGATVSILTTKTTGSGHTNTTGSGKNEIMGILLLPLCPFSIVLCHQWNPFLSSDARQLVFIRAHLGDN